MVYQMEDRWHAVRQVRARAARGALALALAGALAFGSVGCASGSQSSADASSASAASAQAADGSGSDGSDGSADDAEGTAYGATADESPYDLDYTNRDKDPSYDESTATKVALSGTSAQVTGEGASAADGTVTISQAGVYVLGGTFSGQVVVDAPDDAKVQLVLDGADIANASGSCIYVKSADKCFITLAEGSQNSVTDGADYAFAEGEDEPDAAIFSKCDLTLQGSGRLTVVASYNDGVKTKDDLVITGGTYDVTAVGDGFVGKDSVKVADGTINVAAEQGDGVKSSKDDKENKGFVSIDGGTLNITAGDKGLKAETYLRVAGGTVNVEAADDALHSDGSIRIAGGTLNVTVGDDAVHADYELVVDDGTVRVGSCYEGYEGKVITVNGGDTRIVASDDGVNASSGNSGADEFGAMTPGDGGAHGQMDWDAGGAGGQKGWGGDGADDPSGRGGAGGRMQDAPSGEAPGGPSADAAAMGQGGDAGDRGAGQQPPDAQGQGDWGRRGSGQDGMGGRGGMGGAGGMMMDVDEECSLTVNGGTLVVEAQGDGLDSNGTIVLNGGTVYVSGPTSSGDGALDAGTTITANGGTLIAVGAAGMAEGFSDGTQPFAQVSFSGAAGEELQVVDGSGNVVASCTPAKSYQNVVVTAPALQEGGAYTLKAGGQSADFTASTTATATAGGMGGMGGGQMPDGGMGGGRR